MAVFKCKMCGGDLEIIEDSKVAECGYCGTKQTVPSLDNEKKISLFTRANKLRAGCEFDKAAGVYESIVAEFPEEAEAYWGLILCKYGIEYVDDPLTGKKIPTCHRSSFDCVLDSNDFEMVMENADIASRKVYREEAKTIEDLRRAIIEISGKEEPYDIFICYKETDEYGDRTIDSAIAQDVYTALTEKGYRVFFSRISLEDKLGQEYEPYIFAALNSARVMLAFGTDYEYYNAVWVKNEWSRYLQLIAAGAKKTLIPCYKNIDAYDMPKEFAKLQAQDMGKVGAIQDLLRGIEKIIPLSVGNQNDSHNGEISSGGNPSGATVDSLLKRVFLFLEDKKWNDADAYCEKVLDINPEEADAYLGKLMAEKRIRHRGDLRYCENPFTDSDNFQKLQRFGSAELKNEIDGYVAFINQRLENKRIAEERARHEAEELRRAAEIKAQERVQECKDYVLILKCLKKGINPDEYLANRIREINEKKNSLQWVKSILSHELQSLQQTASSIFADEKKLSELKKEKTSLGLFGGKRKKEIDGEIQSVTEKIYREKLLKAEIEEKLCGCLSEEDVAVKSLEYDRMLEELHNTCQRIASRELSSEEEILNDLNSDGIGRSEYNKAFLSKGSVCKLGRYEQHAGKAESVEWIVLAVEKSSSENNFSEEERALVISKYGLDARAFHSSNIGAEWKDSEIRKWLNNEFYNKVFSDEEKNRIKASFIRGSKANETDKGVNDKIFLLSTGEAVKYFSDKKERICLPTEYARKNKAYINSENGACWWWLRSNGGFPDRAAFVLTDGDIYESGNAVDNRNGCIRPAMWITL